MFGSGGFGNRNNTGFGQTSTFGKPSTSFATQGFGTGNTSLFGQPTQPATSLFSNTATAPTFGQQTTTSQAFGGFGQGNNTSIFGSQQPAAGTTGTMFGSPAATTNTGGTGLFSGGSTSFGNNSGFGTFGSSTNTGGLFGQTQQQQTQSTSLFGQPSSSGSSLFTSTASAFGGGNATMGTPIKFTPVTGTDTLMKNSATTNIQIKHHCITCMREYENKSLEELRFEDYALNRKGPSQGTQTGSGLFGNSAQTSLFGSNPSTSNTTSGNVFSSNVSGFGQTGVFGQPTMQANNSLFSKSNTTTGFGTATTTQSGGFSGFGQNTNLFGVNSANQQKSAFGTTQPAGNSIFSGNMGTNNSFGQQQTNTFGSFGTQQQNQQGIGLFSSSQNKFGTGFAAPTQTTSSFTFGTNTNAAGTSSLFAPKPATTGFGVASSAPSAFGSNPFAGNTTNAGTGLFNSSFNKQQPGGFGLGQTSNASTFSSPNLGNNSLFGNTTARPAGSLFSNTGASSGSGVFGNSGFGTNTGLGGSTNTGFGMASGFGSGTADPLQNCTGVATLADIAQLLNAFPYGLSPHHKNLRVCTGKTDELLKPFVVLQKPDDGTNNFKVSTRSSNIVPRRAYAAIDPVKKSLFDKIDDEDVLERNLIKHRQNPRYLKLKPKSLISKDKIAKEAEKASDATFSVEDRNKENRRSLPSTTADQSQTFNRTAFSPDRRNDSTFAANTMTELTTPKRSSTSNKTSPFRSDDSVNRSREPNSSLTNDSVEPDEESDHFIEDDKPHACKVKLRRSDYFTIPTLDDLDEMMDEEGRCIVKNFTIGRRNYGNVVFYDAFDVAGLDLDSIVHFRHKEVEIYPNDAEKPPIGTGLNREAQVTLDRVWPVDKTSREMIKDPTRLKQMNFEGRLKRAAAKMNARFVEYRPLPAGSWVFEVEHFSKYGLDESDDEGGSKKVGKAVDNVPSKPTEKSIPHYLKNIFAGKQGFETAKKRGLDGKFIDDPDSEPMNCDFSFMDENDEVMKDVHSSRTLSSSDSIHELADYPSPTEKLLRKHDSTLHKVQLMKASFYVQDDSPDAEILLEKGTPDLDLLATGRVDAYRSTDSPNKNILPLLKTQFLSKFPPPIDVPVIDFGDEEYKQPVFSPEVKTIAIKARALSRPQRVTTKYRGSVFTTKKSVIKDVTNALCDAGLYFGRRFRVGWSSGLSFVCLAAASEVDAFGEVTYDRGGKLLAGRDANDTSRDVVTRLQMSTEVSPELLKHVESHLEICLKASDLRIQDGVPLFQPQLGVSTLHEHCDLEQKTTRLEENFDRQVWELMVALWGQVPGLASECRNHKTKMLRKSALSAWLKNVIRATAEAEIDEMDPPSQVLELLARGEISEACQVAVNNDDVNLALLISQIGTNEVVRSLMEQQLKQWHESEADQLIDTARLKIVTLVAGHMLYSSSKGFINTCEHLDWKKVFAVHLWYITRPSDSLIEALNQYEQAYMLRDNYAAPPTPSYMKSDIQFETCDGRQVYDVRFHLMKLYSRRSYPLEKVLNPISYTYNVLDYRLSWFIMTTLKSLQYNHLSTESEHSIHTSFAAQLEIYGLWHWAVFVLLHIQDLTARVDYVQRTIDKHVQLLPHGKIGLTDEERFVHEDLHIPIEWIFYSKAVLAVSSNKMVEAAWYYVKAKRWNEAHKVIMNHLLVKAIINGKQVMVQNMLEEIFASGCIVEGWNHGGAIVRDYLTIVGKVNVAITQSVSDVSFLDPLEPLVSSVCSKIKTFPISSPKERICQAEISKRMIQLIQIIAQLRSGKQGLSVNFGVNLIDQLPLPEDYEKQELQEIISRWIDK